MFKKLIQKLALKILNIEQAFNVTCQETLSVSQLKYYLKKWEIKDIIICDSQYCTMTYKDMRELLILNYSRLKDYVHDFYDCDDYSFILKGMLSFLANGYVHGIIHVHTPTGGHALNFFMDDKRKLWYIEPQTNNMITFEQGSRVFGYRPYLAIM